MPQVTLFSFLHAKRCRRCIGPRGKRNFIRAIVCPLTLPLSGKMAFDSWMPVAGS